MSPWRGLVAALASVALLASSAAGEDEMQEPVGESAPVAAPAARVMAHVVASGETLSHIALFRLGDASLWPAIYEANRDQIKDPSTIYPGQELAIPVLDPKRRDAARREAHARNGS